ncbi:sporulation integral membrane protein YtvI [uncultured Clostridium sp.]|uniref:sporulation integral membrane protein YtvI n=1 Tax=Clostridium sp. TaxID=1506 RepID=UPI0025EBAE69|nr:sporulation integral membrane protein YtvI [uncultured Clostridium sp.]
MEYISLVAKKIRPFLNLIIFFLVFTISFSIVIGTLKYTIPFIIGLITASILKKPTEAIIKKFNIDGNLASSICILFFYVITVTLLGFSIVYLCSEIKDLATDGYQYLYDNGSNINVFIQDSLSAFENIDESILESLRSNINKFISDISNYALDFSMNIVNYIIGIISAFPYIVSVIIFAILSTFVFLKKFIKRDSERIKNIEYIKENELDKFLEIITEIKDVVFKYIGTYSILILCTFIITFIGFSILKIPYTLLLSLICMILDLLPIVGMVLVFLPLVIIYFFSGKYITVIFLIILFCGIMITRNILEPKLLSSSLELSQLSVLIAIFVGLNAGGFKGMIYLMALFISFNFYKKYETNDEKTMLKKCEDKSEK